MDNLLTREEIQELVKLPNNFDIRLIDQEYGFLSKIFPIISEEVFNELKESHSTIFRMIAKAGILYSFVLDIPKIKVHISNYGLVQFEQNKTRNANWWDIRDLGLSWVKKADLYLSAGLYQLSATQYKNRIPFFKTENPLVSFWNFNNYYSLNDSVSVYEKLLPLLQKNYDKLIELFSPCGIETLLEDAFLKNKLAEFVMDRTIIDAMDLPYLSFISTGIALQYEELPWQKSVVISVKDIDFIRQRHISNTGDTMKLIFNYLNAHKDKFPCIGEIKNTSGLKVVSKKSGLYL